MTVLLHTIHGSHLYGLNHAKSDTDWYTVVLEGKSRQTIVDGQDTMVITLEDFLKGIEKGTPQAVEALYSPYAEIHPDWRAYFSGLRPGLSLIDTYYRTSINFGTNFGGRHGAALQRAKTSEKSKLERHAVRLCFGISQFIRYGKIDPVLSYGERCLIQAYSWAIHVDPSGDTLRSLLSDALLTDRFVAGRLST